MEVLPARQRLPCRCRKCEARKTVVVRRSRGNAEDQLIAERCSVCGSRGFRVDNWRKLNEWHAGGCRCGAYGKDWPHAKGRGKCLYNEKEPEHD